MITRTILSLGIALLFLASESFAQDGGSITTMVGDQKVEKSFHSNKQLKTEARKRKNGDGEWVTDGIVRTWYASGKKRGELQYKMGVPSGTWKTFYENGKPFDERVFENGKPSGTWKRFYESGKLMDSSSFKAVDDSVMEVSMKVFHKNGKLKEEGKWRREAKKGKKPTSVKDGKWSYFDSEGELERTEVYKDGKLQTEG